MQVIATAGHVDHGKSTLLRALTGMDPDRWAEEKRRGLTIDLGFAWLKLPSGERIAFVDVPGHERFVPNMLAGVGPVPAVLFIVAADEGWMPQSAEHLAVVDALGIRSGLLVITRSDLADPGPAMDQALAELSHSSLGRLPAIAVSAVSGAGLADLVGALDQLTQSLPVPDPGGPVRLWVDRAFTMTGSGTVVTGTLPAGTVHRGDELVVTPSMRPVRVRDIQTLGESAPAATGVARVALNLRGVSKDSVARGMAIVQAGRWTTTDVIDVRICGPALPVPGAQDSGAQGLDAQVPGAQPPGAQPPGGSELAARLPRSLTLHIGSARTLVRVRPLAGDIVRLTLRDPLPLHVGDRILLRDPGAARIQRRPRQGLDPGQDQPMPAQAAESALAAAQGQATAAPVPVSGAPVQASGVLFASQAVLVGAPGATAAGSTAATSSTAAAGSAAVAGSSAAAGGARGTATPATLARLGKSSGTVISDPAEKSTSRDSTANELAGDSTARNGLAGDEVAADSAARYGTARNEPAGDEVAADSTAGNVLAGDSTALDSTALDGAPGDGTAGNGPTGDSTPGDDAAVPGAAGYGAAAYEPAGHGGWPGILGAIVLDVAPPPLARRGAAAAASRELASWPDQPGAAELLRRHGLLRATALLAMGVRDHPEPVAGEWLADPARWQALSAELGEVLAAHTAREPLAPGLPLEAARAALGLPDRRLVAALARPPFRVSGGLVQLVPSAETPVSAGLPESVQAAVRILRADLADAPFAAPDAERLRKLGLDTRSIAAAARAGLLLRISDQIVLAPGAAEAAACILVTLPQPFTAAEARQALATTRRTAIPLLEYLDQAGITDRLPDDRRQLRDAG
jgi:signal recognition particle receptor subunit beta